MSLQVLYNLINNRVMPSKRLGTDDIKCINCD